MPAPSDKSGIQRFMGMVNYLGKFINNFTDKTKPLRELLCKENEWEWTERHQKAFDEIKEYLTSPPVLRYYDVNLPVRLTCDASKSGLGAACLQENIPIAYASKAMTPTQMNYAQIEKELLAVVFACTKFHDYIYGRPVIVETDHQPLVTIFNKPLHAAPVRLQKMMMQLQRYNIKIQYKRGKELYIADTLSRAYTHSDESIIEQEYEVMAIENVSDRRIEQVKRAIQDDEVYRRLMKTIQAGWPRHRNNVHKTLLEYFQVRDELTIDDGVVRRGERLVVPASLQQEYLKILHNGHPGMETTKRRARQTLFWPTIIADITNMVEACSVCNSLKRHQQKEELISHAVPQLPWQYVAMDIFDWNCKQYLVIVDSYSGWYEICTLDDTKSSTIIRKLKKCCAAHGSPEILMSDNAKYCVSFAMKEFARKWNIILRNSSPEYPQSNGLAERAVQSAKQLLEKCKRDGSDVYLALLNMRNYELRENREKGAMTRLQSH
jgi:hypothetical protein